MMTRRRTNRATRFRLLRRNSAASWRTSWNVVSRRRLNHYRHPQEHLGNRIDDEYDDGNERIEVQTDADDEDDDVVADVEDDRNR